MTRVLLIALSVAGCSGGGGPLKRSEPLSLPTIPDQTVLRNVLTPRAVTLEVPISGRLPVDLELVADRPEILPDQTVTCEESPCSLELRPSPEETAAARVELTARRDDEQSTSAFTLQVLPRLVTTSSDEVPGPEGSLRRTLADSVDGDVIGFDSTPFATPQVIPLQAPLGIDGTRIIEGPGRDRATLDGERRHGLIDVAPDGDLTLQGLTLANGLRERGGGIHVVGGHVEIVDCELRGHESVYGAGVLAEEGSILVRNSRFVGNEASQSGGGIYVLQGELHVVDSVFGGPEEGDRNLADRGGAIAQIGGTALIEGSTFEGNEAEYGAGVRAEDSRYYAGTEASLTIRDSTFAGHEVTRSGVIWANADTSLIDVSVVDTITDQAALQLSGPSASLERVVVSDTTSVDGGALRLHAFASQVDDSSIVDNTATDPDGRGGGVWVTRNATIRASEISRNTAPHQGAGMYISDGADVTLEDSVLAENEATSVLGGGIFVQAGATLIVRDTRFEANDAGRGRGGALYVSDDATLDLQSGTLGGSGLGNTAQYGGGLWNDGDTSIGAGVTVRDNVADYGGGLFLGSPPDSEAVVHLGGVAVRDNVGQYRGGGIYIGDKTVLTVDDATSVTGNVAGETNGGGGVYMSRDPMPAATLTAVCDTLAGTIQGNIADGVANDVDGPDDCP